MSNGNGDAGAPGAAEFLPNEEQVAAANKLLGEMQPTIKTAIGTTIRGLLISFPGVQPAAVLSMVAYETGNLLAGAVMGDIVAVAQLRKGFKTAFEEGVQKAPIKPLPAGAGPQMTAPPNLRG